MTRQQAVEFFDALHNLEKAVGAVFGEKWGHTMTYYVKWAMRIEEPATWNEMMSLYPGAEPADAQPSENPSNQNNQP